MIKHIVMWTLKEQDTEKKAAIAQEVKNRIEALKGKIDGLISAEVGINFNSNGYDICLVSALESKDALSYYQDLPLHVEVKNFVVSVVSERAVSDYEI